MTQKKSSLSTASILIIVFSIAGLGIMTYLTYIHFSHTQSFCNISETVSCDVVTTSIYSEIFGLPVSILGLLFFAIILLLMLFSKKKNISQIIFFLTLFALIPSLYLSLIELFAIKAFCILCESSKVLMFAILFTSYAASKKTARIDFRMMAPIIIAGVVAGGITYFAQTGTVVKKDYSELVACLNKNDIVYYKSVRCNNCARQERLLGDAYIDLNSVECHPDGLNANPELCLEKGIDKTPTFLIERNGVEIKRVEGLQTVDNLASFANCPLLIL